MNAKSDKKILIFDLDDTLIDTSDIYWQAKNAFINLIVNQNPTLNENYVSDLFETVETSNLKTYGLIPERYKLSMFDTYEILQNRSLVEENKNLKSKLKSEKQAI